MMPQEDFIDGDFFEGLFDFKILGWDCLEKIKAEKPKFIYTDTNHVLDLFGFLNNNEDSSYRFHQTNKILVVFYNFQKS